MAKKQTTTIGIEYDNLGIRVAKVKATPRGKDTQFQIEKLEEISGNVARDEDLVAGLKNIRGKLSAGGTDRIVSCISGKQLYAAQIPFKRLPDEEMRNALRFEIRKNLPFEVAGSTLEYQYVSTGDKKNEISDVLVASVANILLNRHIALLSKAGFKPRTVDILPLVAANAFWAAQKNGTAEEKPAGSAGANIILHIGPDMSSVIIDGEESSFFHRTIYFTAKELGGDGQDELPMREKERRISGLTDELVRSLSFYESNYHTASFSTVHLLGNYLKPELLEIVESKTGLHTQPIDLVKTLMPGMETVPGKYDLAVALGMRD